MDMLDGVWTEPMKNSVVENFVYLIDNVWPSIARIMDILVEEHVFFDTQCIMHNTSLHTPKDRVRRLLEVIQKKRESHYWKFLAALFDEQVALGHIAKKILGTLERHGGRVSNDTVRRLRRDYQESQVDVSSSPQQHQQRQQLQRQQQRQEQQRQEQQQQEQQRQEQQQQQRQQQPILQTGSLEAANAQHDGRLSGVSDRSLPITSDTQSLPMDTDAGGQPPQAGAASPPVSSYEDTKRRSPDTVYRMESEPRGRALIINNKTFDHLYPREGTDSDRDSLVNLLQELLNFEVVLRNDQTGLQMKNELNSFSRDQRLANVGAIMVVILTHGGAGDILFGVDGRVDGRTPARDTYISTSDVRAYFTATACPALRGKPKLIILQACRGVLQDTSQGHVPVPSSVDVVMERQDQRCQPDFCDIYTVYPTVSNFVAYRQTMIPLLVEVLREHARDTHFKDMISVLQRKRNAYVLEIGAERLFSTIEEQGNLPNKLFFNPPDLTH